MLNEDLDFVVSNCFLAEEAKYFYHSISQSFSIIYASYSIISVCIDLMIFSKDFIFVWYSEGFFNLQRSENSCIVLNPISLAYKVLSLRILYIQSAENYLILYSLHFWKAYQSTRFRWKMCYILKAALSFEMITLILFSFLSYCTFVRSLLNAGENECLLNVVWSVLMNL